MTIIPDRTMAKVTKRMATRHPIGQQGWGMLELAGFHKGGKVLGVRPPEATSPGVTPPGARHQGQGLFELDSLIKGCFVLL